VQPHRRRADKKRLPSKSQQPIIPTSECMLPPVHAALVLEGRTCSILPLTQGNWSLPLPDRVEAPTDDAPSLPPPTGGPARSSGPTMRRPDPDGPREMDRGRVVPGAGPLYSDRDRVRLDPKAGPRPDPTRRPTDSDRTEPAPLPPPYATLLPPLVYPVPRSVGPGPKPLPPPPMGALLRPLPLPLLTPPVREMNTPGAAVLEPLGGGTAQSPLGAAEKRGATRRVAAADTPTEGRDPVSVSKALSPLLLSPSPSPSPPAPLPLPLRAPFQRVEA
jgi:hypothetical protein